ncbi:benzoate 1,2-dioxygenase subunit beta [Acinetobacter baumannii]|nr:benzoate 1,2-dioxygenase subunit beta [Acinetobacter baumannii]
MSTQDKVTLENIAQFLYREARFLDDEQWDDWLECYAPEASFWMPAWDDDDRLTEDPEPVNYFV